MLILLLIAVALLVLGIVLDRKGNDLAGLTLGVFGVIGVVLIAIGWPVQYYDMKSEIAQYHDTERTIEQARKNGISDVERAALTTKIIELNRGLVDAQFWNQTIFDDFIPDEVMQLKPLK